MPFSFSANRILVFFLGLWVSLSFGLLAVSCSGERPRDPEAPPAACGQAPAELGGTLDRAGVQGP